MGCVGLQLAKTTNCSGAICHVMRDCCKFNDHHGTFPVEGNSAGITSTVQHTMLRQEVGKHCVQAGSSGVHMCSEKAGIISPNICCARAQAEKSQGEREAGRGFYGGQKLAYFLFTCGMCKSRLKNLHGKNHSLTCPAESPIL